jgi:glycosyltransferase involved in cell wall biosynthesis
MLVEPGDPAALAGAIDRLLSNQQEGARLGERASAHARAEYDLSRMIHRYVGLYEAALARPARSSPHLRPKHASLR